MILFNDGAVGVSSEGGWGWDCCGDRGGGGAWALVGGREELDICRDRDRDRWDLWVGLAVLDRSIDWFVVKLCSLLFRHNMATLILLVYADVMSLKRFQEGWGPRI